MEKKLSKWQISKLKVGDKIKVRTFHYRIGYRTVIRKISDMNESMETGRNIGIAIRMFGYDNFWLRKGEILEKIKD